MFTKKEKISFRNNTFICLIIFSVAILLFLWFFQIMFLNVFYEKYQTNKMNKLALKIIKYNDEELSTKLETIAYENSICMEYVDSYNFRYMYNTKMVGCGLNKSNKDIREYITEFYKSNKKISAIRLVDENSELKALLYQIKVKDSYVFMYSTLEDVNTTSIVLKNQLIYITAVMILISGIVSYFISKRITDPIVDITKKASLMGTGKDVVFDKTEVKELDDLIATLNNAEKEVKKTDEYRRDLMANVSHDLKTPLTMIKAYAEMVRDFDYDKDKMQENLNIIIDETDRLTVLVNNILEVSKLQANKNELNIEKYDLTNEIIKIIKKYDYLKEKENYNFVSNLEDNVIIKADKDKLNQVLYNLINNAINYTGKDKTIYINLIDEKKKYKIEIIDTGKGIDKEDIPYIWNKYYKSAKNYKRSVVGTGLGLSIVKEILTLHNFKYGVDSNNKGTKFYFYIKKM